MTAPRLAEHLEDIRSNPQTSLHEFQQLFKSNRTFHTSWWGERFISFAGYSSMICLDEVSDVFIDSITATNGTESPLQDRLAWLRLCTTARALYEEADKTSTVFSNFLNALHLLKMQTFRFGNEKERAPAELLLKQIGVEEPIETIVLSFRPHRAKELFSDDESLYRKIPTREGRFLYVVTKKMLKQAIKDENERLETARNRQRAVSFSGLGGATSPPGTLARQRTFSFSRPTTKATGLPPYQV